MVTYSARKPHRRCVIAVLPPAPGWVGSRTGESPPTRQALAGLPRALVHTLETDRLMGGQECPGVTWGSSQNLWERWRGRPTGLGRALCLQRSREGMGTQGRDHTGRVSISWTDEGDGGLSEGKRPPRAHGGCRTTGGTSPSLLSERDAPTGPCHSSGVPGRDRTSLSLASDQPQPEEGTWDNTAVTTSQCY